MTLRNHLLWAKPLLISVVMLSSPEGIAQAADAPRPQMGPGSCGTGIGRSQSDQRFIEMMIHHHDAAIAMAELAQARSQRPQIKMLAERIQRSQSAENAQMRRWYRQWFNTEVPRSPVGMCGVGPGMGMGMGMGEHSWMGGGMPGMGSSLTALTNATDFDQVFIEQMIPHHRMGVMMATHASWTTQHPDLRNLQAAMVKVQSQEIIQMEQWYRQWYGALRR